MSSRRPRIVVADDSTVAREGIAAIIRDLRYALCGLATDQRTTSELLQQHQPDLLLIEPFLGIAMEFFLSRSSRRVFLGRGFSLYRDNLKRFMQNARSAPGPQATG